MTKISKEFEAKLRQLKMQFAKVLPAKIQEIRDAWRPLKEGSQSPEILETFFRLVHGMAGSAGTFGFMDLGKVAQNLEGLLLPFRSRERENLSNQTKEIEAMLAEITSLVTQENSFEDHSQTGKNLFPLLGAPKDLSSELIFWLGQDSKLIADIKKALRGFHLEVFEFKTAEELRKRLQNTYPRLVVVDLVTPEGLFQGTASLKPLLEDPTPETPILLINPRTEDLEPWLECIRCEVQGLLPKPFSFYEFLQKMNAMTRQAVPHRDRVLLVDDDQLLSEKMALILEKAGMIVEVVNNPRQVLERAAAFRPDLFLLDLNLPTCSGLELVRILGENSDHKGIPIVCITSDKEAYSKSKAFQYGAEDFIVKPIVFHLLYHSLATRIKHSKYQRGHLTRDHLTGLFNHTELQHRLADEIFHALPLKLPVTYALIDIDHFKKINLHNGHRAGDDLLKTLAGLLAERLGPEVDIGRHGGDEFSLVFRGTGAAQAKLTLERIRNDFGRFELRSDRGTFTATFSCGLAESPANADYIQLTEAAEKALERAKSGESTPVIAAFEGRRNPAAGVAPSSRSNTGQAPPPLQSLKVDRSTVTNEEQLDHDKQTIVLIEDDVKLRESLSQFLRYQGYHLIPAASGDEGWRLVERYKPNLVITDLLLFPGMHGFELCERIKASDALKHIPVILITAVYKDERYIKETQTIGAEALIKKPLNLDSLLSKINDLISTNPSPVSPSE